MSSSFPPAAILRFRDAEYFENVRNSYSEKEGGPLVREGENQRFNKKKHNL